MFEFCFPFISGVGYNQDNHHPINQPTAGNAKQDSITAFVQSRKYQNHEFRLSLLHIASTLDWIISRVIWYLSHYYKQMIFY